MALCSGQALAGKGPQQHLISSCTFRRCLTASKGLGLRQSSHPDVSVAASTLGAGANSFPNEVPHSHRLHPDISCRAVLVAERELATKSPELLDVVRQSPPSGPKPLPIDVVDVAIIGADVAGLAAALAAARAQPGARVMLYDTAAEPPVAHDGGALLSVNGQRALRAMDPALHQRFVTEMSSSLHESLWFDMEGELVRRTPLGQPSMSSSTAVLPGVSSRRRSALRRRALAPSDPRSSSGGSRAGSLEPDPGAPPLMVGLHELREALAEALPPDVQIFGRHHIRAAEASPGGGALIHFAPSPGGSPVRAVRARMLVGADGLSSVVKRLQFDTPAECQPKPSGRTVWRGRFTLRKRDPDFALLRNFTTATRSWVDLKAPAGSERTSTLSPAGPNTFVWTASCPTSLLASRGLTESGASAYWRCLAMFEDFPQDFFAALRATADNAVVELASQRAPSPAAAASLAAPWQWASGAAALVGDAVMALPADDPSSTAVNLALEDAAVLGTCIAQYGMTQRAMTEYARLRGPRVSAMLALPPSAPERLRLRDAPFLTLPGLPANVAAPVVPVAKPEPSLEAVVVSAVDAAAAAAATVDMASPLQRVLAQAAAASPTYTPSVVDLGRPSGGASRSPSPSPGSPSMSEVSYTAPASPLFNRPSGARRMGPLLPAVALASVAGLLLDRAGAAAASSIAAAVDTTAGSSKTSKPVASAPAAGSSKQPGTAHYAAEATPLLVWTALSPPAAAATILSSSRGAAAADTRGMAAAVSLPEPLHAGSSPAQSLSTATGKYCAPETPMGVWQALLVAPDSAHDMPVTCPSNAAESPALVSMPPLGPQLAPAAPSAAGVTTMMGATAVATATAARDPHMLLPKPLMKSTQTKGPGGPVAPEGPAVMAATADPTAALEVPCQLQPPPSLGSGRGRRVGRHGYPGPSAGAPASHRKGSRGGPAGSKSHRRAPNAARSAAAAANAAAKVTVSLSAAAALGGVISAGGGHMPLDVATALHVHGTVAQFWDELNNLTLSSMSSMSSMDI